MTMQDAPPPVARLKLALFLLALLPFGRLLWAAWTGDFGPNPVEFVQRLSLIHISEPTRPY